MKKIIIFTLMLSFVLVCFCACAEKDNELSETRLSETLDNDEIENEFYDSYICDIANDGVLSTVETTYWTGTYFTKENMPQKSCDFNGKTYTGSYQKSIVNKPNSYTTNIYNDGNGLEFGIRDDNGALVYINFMTPDFFETEPYLCETIKSYKEAILLASNIADRYLEDPSLYTLFDESKLTRQYEKDGKIYELTYYYVTFAKKVQGYFSSDHITVRITSKGNIASVYMGDINAFDGKDMKIDVVKLDESLSNKIQKTYDKVGFSVSQSKVEDQKIVLTPDGDVCVYSYVSIKGVDSNKNERATAVYVLTFLNDSSNNNLIN